jgi:hypothetical protein
MLNIAAYQEGTPLHTAYSFSFMRRGKASKPDDGNASAHGDKPAEEKQEAATTTPHPYENSIKTISTVKTIEQFWSTYNYLKRPNDLSSTTDYHFFRDGIKPTWEDSKNAKGGKWIVSDAQDFYNSTTWMIVNLFLCRNWIRILLSLLLYSFVLVAALCIWNLIVSSSPIRCVSCSRSVCPRV